MKKIYLIICTNFFVLGLVNAQITKGSLWLGGDMGFSISKNEYGQSVKQTSYSISPSIGTTVKQNMVLGLEANFTHSQYDNSATKQTNATSGGAIFLRQYWQIVNRLYAFGHFTASYTSTNQTNE